MMLPIAILSFLCKRSNAPSDTVKKYTNRREKAFAYVKRMINTNSFSKFQNFRIFRPKSIHSTAFYNATFIVLVPPPKNPCNPSPCGPNSICREINGQAVCSCVPGFIGSPPTCRPECVTSAECPLNEACINQKCVNPCLGTCGIGALCQVVNHNPICSCPARYTGDPFVRCVALRKLSRWLVW